MLYNKNINKQNIVIYSLQYLFIFCTKYRRNVLSQPIQIKAKEIIQNVSIELNCKLKSLEIMQDHVYLMADLPYNLAPHKFIKTVKGRTSNLLRKEFKELVTRLPCLWTKSYFVCSVGNVSAENIKQYIDNQWKK